ncbi:hypothetical protein Cantr_03733 [Candida viswanathii]|uniref:Transcription factor IIIC 90kDa subunit N-terminal domain-containing protein n=1 Tax=Candida viswanathii TaxID=5486 RepID=A0A367XQA1_9ASCO|nr:hypothetical protein Cantr_03733 [Candida viswanathii]
MSLAKSIKLNRVDLAASQNTPVQWSDNHQISFNLYANLKVLEPKLPNYFQTIKGKEGRAIFEQKELFTESTLLNSELINMLPLGRFNKVIIADNEDMLNLQAHEPNVVLQQWTPNFENSRDNLLGLLFNSAELLVLGRKNSQNAFAVRINMFDILADKYSIQGDNENLYVSAEEYKKLKIKYFTFSTHDGALLLTAVDHNNTLLVFEVDPSTFNTHLRIEKHMEVDIIKILWSEDSKFLSVIGFDNSLTVWGMVDALKESKELVPPARFKNHLNKYVEHEGQTYLVSTFTGKVVIFALESSTHTEFKLDSYYTPVSILSGVLDGILTLVIPLDSGDIITLKYNFKAQEVSKVALDKSLDVFIAKSLYAFQFNSGEESETIEPWFRVFDLHALPNGLIAIVYKITRKDTIDYRTPGFMDVRLQFLKLSEPIGTKSEVEGTTSLAKLVELYLSDYENLPIFSDDLSLLRKERVKRFFEQMTAYTEAHLVPIELDSNTEPLADLKTTLREKFIKNSAVLQAQYYHVLAKLLRSPLVHLVRDSPEEIEALIKKIDTYKQGLENSLIIYLRTLILRYYDGKLVEHEVDKFSLITMYNLLRKLSSELSVQIPDSAEVTINSKYYSETFKVGTDDIIRDESTIQSTLGHGWIQCQLTNVPLLAMNNKTDELAQFRYIIPDDKMGPLTKELLDIVDFCFITGNRTYPLK